MEIYLDPCSKIHESTLKFAKSILAVHAELYSISALYWSTGPGTCVLWSIVPT